MRLREIIGTIFLVLLTFIAGAAVVGSCYQKYSLTGGYRKVFQGRITGKNISMRETSEGSLAVKYLVIEEEGVAPSQVIVSNEVYDKAEIGMWIKSGEEGVKLFTSDPRESASQIP